MTCFYKKNNQQRFSRHAICILALLTLPFLTMSCVSHVRIDCSDPTDSSEQALCERSVSSGGDDVMSAAYFATINLIDERHLSLNRWDVVAQQQAWVQEKESCDEDYRCLNRVYKSRLEVLTAEWRGQSFDAIGLALERADQGQIESDRLQRFILFGYSSGNHATSVPFYDNLLIFDDQARFISADFNPKYWGNDLYGTSRPPYPTPNLYRMNDPFGPIEPGFDELSIEQIGGTHYTVGYQSFRVEPDCIRLVSWDGGVRDDVGGEPTNKICLEDYDSSIHELVEDWIISLEPTQ